MDVILFMDFDGVVSSMRNQFVNQPFDPLAIELIAKVINDAEEKYNLKTKIVVISERRKLTRYGSGKMVAEVMESVLTGSCPLTFHESYRVPPHTSSEGILDFLEESGLKPADIKEYHGVWGEIDIDYTRNWRGWCVADWLLQFDHWDKPYIVLDDSYDLFPLPAENVLRIKGGETDGFQIEHFDKLTNMYKTIAEKHNVGHFKEE